MPSPRTVAFTPEEIFEMIDFPDDPEGQDCWLWAGATVWNKPHTHQYGVAGLRGYVHRFVFEHLGNVIPPDMELDHLCRETLCVNPKHLQPVSHLENVRRGNSMIKKTHCKNGHELTPDNLTIHHKPRFSRECRICHNEHTRKSREKNKEKT